jgi:hypothetical protein
MAVPPRESHGEPAQRPDTPPAWVFIDAGRERRENDPSLVGVCWVGGLGWQWPPAASTCPWGPGRGRRGACRGNAAVSMPLGITVAARYRPSRELASSIRQEQAIALARRLAAAQRIEDHDRVGLSVADAPQVGRHPTADGREVGVDREPLASTDHHQGQLAGGRSSAKIIRRAGSWCLHRASSSPHPRTPFRGFDPWRGHTSYKPRTEVRGCDRATAPTGHHEPDGCLIPADPPSPRFPRSLAHMPFRTAMPQGVVAAPSLRQVSVTKCPIYGGHRAHQTPVGYEGLFSAVLRRSTASSGEGGIRTRGPAFDRTRL